MFFVVLIVVVVIFVAAVLDFFGEYQKEFEKMTVSLSRSLNVIDLRRGTR